jgi:hypothetical protein
MDDKQPAGLWRMLNSPLIVLVIALGLWPIASSIAMRWKLRTFSSEVRALAQETTGEKDAGTLKLLVSGWVSQVASGLSGAFSQMGEDHAKTMAEFRRVHPSILVTDVKAVESSWPGREKVVGRITNNSDQAIDTVKITSMFYDASGSLIDVDSKWLSDIKVIEPKTAVGFSVERTMGQGNEPAAQLEARRSKRVEIQVSDFEIVKQASK